ncbi:MAG: protein-glutamate O-methyltransferase CheR [Desulfobacteraceae bacterium]|nr:protein-glutamate O-methyltransferase CheR [Desulfobacteraceae bacterium]
MNSRSNIGFKKSVKITPQEINLLSTYIYSISGIHIEPGKAYLLETRFNRMLDSEKCKNFSELYHKAKADKSKTIEKKIIDAITTNETLFFRDSNPFELLKQKIIPEVIDKNTKSGQHSAPTPLRIWSAACSTGQEIYSIAIVLKELMISPNKFNIQLIGTDLSDAAIKQASYGLYNKFEIERGLALEKLQRYFTPIGSNWKIKDEIRSMASFSKFNLMDPIARLGKFDIVLCRNVAIYFTLEDRKKLFDKIAGCLNPGGYLLIGSTESLSGVCPRFVPKRHLKSIFYQIK